MLPLLEMCPFSPPQRSKAKAKVTQDLLDEKEERIQHLEEVNRTLKQTNDEQAEELGELREKLRVLTAEVSGRAVHVCVCVC